MNDRATVTRQAALLAVVFVATFALLAGGRALLGAAGTAGGPSGSLPGASPAGPPASVPGSLGAPGSSGSPGPAIVPSTEPVGSGEAPTVVITGAGDIADCASDGARQTSDLLVEQAGSIFTAGNNATEGSAASFADCYGPTWGRVRDRTILPAAGNEDWNTADAAGYLGYFGSNAAPNGVTWYSLDLGAWHVIVLDSDCAQVGGCDAASPQGQWLKKDLAASSVHCTLAIWNRPRYSSGEQGDDPEVASFWEQLHAANAELIVNGHDRDYERFAPLDASGNVERPGGLREIVVGTGGAALRPFHTLAAHSEFRLAGSWGVLRLTLHPANYDWEFLPVGGDIADSGSTPCH